MSETQIWRRVASLVDQQRRTRDLSVRALASHAGVDESTVRRLLDAEAVRLGSLRAIASSLGLGWGDLLVNLSGPGADAALQVSGSHR